MSPDPPDCGRDRLLEDVGKSFALLLLSPYLLTERLHPLLAKAAGQRGAARIVNVLSGGMYTQKIHVEDLQSRQGTYSGSVACARAKRGLMILAEEWARRWARDGIVVNAMHPGWADTPGVLAALPEFHRVTGRVLRTPEQGADTISRLAAATEAGKVSGEFWPDRRPHAQHLLPGTRETPAERRELLKALAAFAQLRGLRTVNRRPVWSADMSNRLTTTAGCPAVDRRNVMTAGPRGPQRLQDFGLFGKRAGSRYVRRRPGCCAACSRNESAPTAVTGPDNLDLSPLLKLFTPDASATMLLTELDAEDPDPAARLGWSSLPRTALLRSSL